MEKLSALFGGTKVSSPCHGEAYQNNPSKLKQISNRPNTRLSRVANSCEWDTIEDSGQSKQSSRSTPKSHTWTAFIGLGGTTKKQIGPNIQKNLKHIFLKHKL